MKATSGLNDVTFCLEDVFDERVLERKWNEMYALMRSVLCASEGGDAERESRCPLE